MLVSSARFVCALFCHMVLPIEVPIAAASVRRKLITPAADAVSSGLTAPSAMIVSGMKKNGMPSPWTSCGAARIQKSAPLNQKVRSTDVSPSQKIPKHTSARGSTLLLSLATIGEKITASTPLNAVT